MVDIPSNGRHFIIGTAFDDLLTFWADRRGEKYYIDDWLRKADLIAKLIERPEDRRRWFSLNAIKSAWLDILRWIYYDDTNQEKIRLTPAEGRDMMGMYREACRQKLADVQGVYSRRKIIEAEYMGLKIRGELDRFIFSNDKGERYTCDYIDDMIATKGRDYWLQFAHDNQLFWVIRDWKTCGRLDSLEFDIEETFDYVASMSFYYTLVYIHYWVESKYVVLDVLGKSEPYPYIWYMLQGHRIKNKIKEYIKPWLEALIEAYKHDNRFPRNPITGLEVSRIDMMKSKAYPYMDESIQQVYSSPDM